MAQKLDGFCNLVTQLLIPLSSSLNPEPIQIHCTPGLASQVFHEVPATLRMGPASIEFILGGELATKNNLGFIMSFWCRQMVESIVLVSVSSSG